jgi:hypothetical protein
MTIAALLLTLTGTGAVAEFAGIGLGTLAIQARTKHLQAFEDSPPNQTFTIGAANELNWPDQSAIPPRQSRSV